MKNPKDCLTTLSPLKSYTPPELPKLKDAGNDPMFLKTLPSRWQNNAKVLTCVGLIGAGMITLSGCLGEIVPGGNNNPGGAVCTCNENDTHGPHHGGSPSMPIYVDTNTEQDLTDYVLAEILEEDLEFRSHWGGSGAGPFYVIYLTEQEVISIILSKLEDAGLRFATEPPDYTVDIEEPWSFHDQSITFGLDYFDADVNVAIAHVGTRRYQADEISKGFEQQDTDLSVGVFYTPGLSPDNEWGYNWDMNVSWEDDHGTFFEPDDDQIADAKAKARPLLEAELESQIQQFINFLIAERIITPDD